MDSSIRGCRNEACFEVWEYFDAILLGDFGEWTFLPLRCAGILGLVDSGLFWRLSEVLAKYDEEHSIARKTSYAITSNKQNITAS